MRHGIAVAVLPDMQSSRASSFSLGVARPRRPEPTSLRRAPLVVAREDDDGNGESTRRSSTNVVDDDEVTSPRFIPITYSDSRVSVISDAVSVLSHSSSGVRSVVERRGARPSSSKSGQNVHSVQDLRPSAPSHSAHDVLPETLPPLPPHEPHEAHELHEHHDREADLRAVHEQLAIEERGYQRARRIRTLLFTIAALVLAADGALVAYWLASPTGPLHSPDALSLFSREEVSAPPPAPVITTTTSTVRSKDEAFVTARHHLRSSLDD